MAFIRRNKTVSKPIMALQHDPKCSDDEPDLGPEPAWLDEAREATKSIMPSAKAAKPVQKEERKPEPAKKEESKPEPKEPEKPAAAVDLHKAPRVKESERLPSHSLQSEQGVLGCLLLDPTLIGFAMIRLRSGVDTFYDLRHQTIFEALLAMDASSQKIDVITLQMYLRQHQSLDAVGGGGFVSGLPDPVPSTGMLSEYINIVNDQSLRRDLERVGGLIASAAGTRESASSVLPELETELLKLGRSKNETKSKKISALISVVAHQIEGYQENKGKISGLSTGFPDLDRMTTGLAPGDYWIIAGVTSTGKSSLATNIIDHLTVEEKIPASYFTLEMSAESLTLRLKCSRARVDSNRLRRGLLDDQEIIKLASAGKKLASAPLYFHDESGLQLSKFRSVLRQHVSEYGIKAFVLDYLQLMNNATRKGENREREVAQVSNEVKSCARDFGIAAIVLSQFNRDFEKNPNRKPRLADIRESAAIYQDADLVGLLYRPIKDDEEPNPADEVMRINLLIAKQRNGAIGDVPLIFSRVYTRFESAAIIAEEDLPQ